MLAPLLSTLRALALLAVTVAMYGLLELETAFRRRALREAVLAKWVGRYGRCLLRLFGVSVEARGLGLPARRVAGSEGGRGRIFVANHRSGLDIPILLAHLDAALVSRADVARWPVLGPAARRAGTLFVERSSKESGAAVIAAMVDRLRAGRGVLVFPEGTTFEGDEVRPLRAGAMVAAARAGADVVPVGIAYGDPRATYLDTTFTAHLRRVSGLRSLRAVLRVGAPLPADGADIEASRARARAAMQELVDDARRALDDAAHT